MSTSIIVAYDENRGIGYNNQLPWPSIKEDFVHFKQTTLNQNIIMGKNTWYSLPKRPLVNRTNIVITSSPIEGVINFKSLEEALKQFKNSFIIGGGQLYAYALKNNLIDLIIASEIKEKYKADTYFPFVDWKSNIVQEFENFKIVEYKK